MTRDQAITKLKSLRYHCDFAIGFLEGQRKLYDHIPNGQDPDSHPHALFCVGPFAIYDRFRTGVLKPTAARDLAGKPEQIFSYHKPEKS
jgi:hypothetical protein